MKMVTLIILFTQVAVVVVVKNMKKGSKSRKGRGKSRRGRGKSRRGRGKSRRGMRARAILSREQDKKLKQYANQ